MFDYYWPKEVYKSGDSFQTRWPNWVWHIYYSSSWYYAIFEWGGVGNSVLARSVLVPRPSAGREKQMRARTRRACSPTLLLLLLLPRSEKDPEFQGHY